MLDKANDILVANDQVISLKQKLTTVNEMLWDIEDKIREKELRTNLMRSSFTSLAQFI